MRRSLFCLLLLLALPVTAQIYKYTDANGNTAYTNQPPDGVKVQTVDLPPLPPINSVAAPAPQSAAPSSQPTAPTGQPPTTYTLLELVDMPEGEALRANSGTFSLGVRVEPRLASGHLLQLLVDGNLYGQPTNVPRLQVVNLDRGEHSFAVVVLDKQRILQQSPTLTFTVQRVHVGKP